MCRGLGDQRRDASERGRMKEHRPALLPTQPPVVVMLRRSRERLPLWDRWTWAVVGVVLGISRFI